MSNALKQILVVAAVVAISMVFIIQFRPGTDVQLSGGPTCAIEVTGDCIPHSDFVAAYRLAAPNIDPEQLKQMRLRQAILEGLVERWMLVEDAKRLGIDVSSEDVARFIGGKALARFSLPASREQQYIISLMRMRGGQIMPPPIGPAVRIPVLDPKTNGFDYERYQRWVVRSSGKTEKDFKEFQRQEAIAARMRGLIKSRVRVSEREAFEQYARGNEKVIVDYIKLERGFFREHVLDRSGEAIAAWREANQSEIDEAWASRKDVFLPECRKARHILFRIDETDPDQEAAKTKAKEQADAARKRIEGGEAFAAVAKELSEDASTKKEGGDLGCFAAGKLSRPATTKAVDDAAYALAVGAVSEPIESTHGYHLVTVDKIAGEEEAEDIGRKTVAFELYERKESERLAAEAAKQILAAVKDGKTLEQALSAQLSASLGDTEVPDADKPKVETSDAFTQAMPPFSQVQNPTDAAKVLFDLDKPGDVPGDVIKLYDGYAVAQLKERKPVDEETWKKDRAEFMDQLREEKQRDALIAYVQRLHEQYGKEIVYKVPLSEEEPKEGEAPAPKTPAPPPAPEEAPPEEVPPQAPEPPEAPNAPGDFPGEGPAEPE